LSYVPLPSAKPGTGGLPVEFYKIFWKNIKKLVMNSFSYTCSYENENMSISQKQSIITLLPKKNNDVRFLKNWRPISLIVSNAFSKSIDKTIHELFSSSARSITSRRLLILSPIYRPFIKPDFCL
jgi:hypothetical protein